MVGDSNAANALPIVVLQYIIHKWPQWMVGGENIFAFSYAVGQE